MRAMLSPRPSLDLCQIIRLTRRLEGRGESVLPIRIGIVHTYTSEPLDPYLRFEASLQGLAAAVHHAPYGLTVQETSVASGLRAHAPDLTLVLLRWEDLGPALARPISAAAGPDLAACTVEAAVKLAATLRRAVAGHILLSLLPPMLGPGLGIYDASAMESEAAWRAAVKAETAVRLRTDLASVTFLDLDEIVAEMGRGRFFDRRWWYTARFPFSPQAAQELARRTMSVAAVLKWPRAKVIALDADNTLWGGLIGEDGINGIALGPDYPGNAYLDFQRRLLHYKQRGLLLALCSKNDAGQVLEVLRHHPHQVLREEHFAAMRVNWRPKAANLVALAAELELGLESFVLVDDSAYECLSVRRSLPQVEVVQVPPRAVDIPTMLDSVARLEVVGLTAEDGGRTEMYRQEHKRQAMAEGDTDVASHLRSLDMRMVVRVDDAGQVARIAQLTQKTNQFNLTTRRYSESDIQELIDSPEWLVAHFSLTDIFGDSGLVGAALVRLEAPATAEIDTLLMSCRVLGRRAESAFLESVLALLRGRGVHTVVADYIPTARNHLAEGFLSAHGFTRRDDGRQTRDLAAAAPAAVADLPIQCRWMASNMNSEVRGPIAHAEEGAGSP
jgi:FkbH-like protein